MKTLTVKLPEPLATWLARRAKQLGRPQSELVRDALERSRDGETTSSCHDLMADVCGGISGPKDLSTNPKYLDGFGK
jgi:Ribbon-helix-helix protein, copG family